MNLEYLPPDDYMMPMNDYYHDQLLDLDYSLSSHKNSTTKSFITPSKIYSKTKSQDFTEPNHLPHRAQSSSKTILAKVLEENWFTSNPSNRKKEIISQNIRKSKVSSMNSPARGNVDIITASKFCNYYPECQPFVDKAEELFQFFENVKDSDFAGLEDLTVDEKVIKYLELTKSPQKDVKFSAFYGIYLLLEDGLSESAIDLILEELFLFIENWEEVDDESLEYVLNLIGNIGPSLISIEKIPLILPILIHDQTSSFAALHLAAFACLFRLGFAGIKVLVKLAAKDEPYLQNWILNRLVISNFIQKYIIVPALAQDAYNGSNSLKVQAVAALNRMYSVVWEGGALPVLLRLLEEGDIDRPLISCTIRGCGQIGEKTLIKLLKTSLSGKIKMACAGALCWRVPSRPKQIQIRVVSDSVSDDNLLTPGSLWKYIGPVKPVVQDETESILEIRERDLLASLQRLVRKESENSSGDVFPLLPDFTVIQNTVIEDTSEISCKVIKALCGALKDKHSGVRETAAYSLGFIGLPEASDSVVPLSCILTDKSPQIRTMAAWAIGRLGVESAKVTSELLYLLKDEYLKVRNAACISLASAGQSAAAVAIPFLLKILKDGSINRSTVAETITRLGPQGEKTIIELLNKEPIGNIVLRTAIIKALGQANIFNNNIDYVIETLFKLCNDKISQIRKEALLSLQTIFERSNRKLTYLQPKTLLPLYFKYLKDPCKEIRNICVKNILSIGPQGELTLIEAFSKDSNYIVRAQAAKGIGMMGTYGFKTLILGLHDSHQYVRKTVANTIYKHFSLNELVEEFTDKSQRGTLKCAIKEIMNLPYVLSLGCANLLKEFLNYIDKNCKEE